MYSPHFKVKWCSEQCWTYAPETSPECDGAEPWYRQKYGMTRGDYVVLWVSSCTATSSLPFLLLCTFRHCLNLYQFRDELPGTHKHERSDIAGQLLIISSSSDRKWDPRAPVSEATVYRGRWLSWVGTFKVPGHGYYEKLWCLPWLFIRRSYYGVTGRPVLWNKAFHWEHIAPFWSVYSFVGVKPSCWSQGRSVVANYMLHNALERFDMKLNMMQHSVKIWRLVACLIKWW